MSGNGERSRRELERLHSENARLRAENEQLQNQLTDSRRRLQQIVAGSPLLVRELDVRPLMEHFHTLRAQGVTEFRAYFDAHPEQVPVCVNLARVVYASQNLLNLYGARDGEELQHALAREMTPERWDIARSLMTAFAENRPLPSFETYVRTLQNEERYLITQASYVSASDPAAPHVLFLSVDATEHKHAEIARRASEERFRRLMTLIPDAVLIHADRRLQYVNPAGRRLFGAETVEALLETSVLDLLHPDFHAEAQHNWQQPMNGEPRLLTAYRKIRRLDGAYIDAEVNEVAFADAEGRCLHLMVIRDITERLQAETTLREREALYRSVIAAADGVVYHMDAHTGTYTFLSPEIEQLTGIPAKEFTLKSWIDLQGKSFMRGGMQGLHIGDAVGLHREGKLPYWKADTHYRHRNGDWRWVSDSSVALFDAQGKYQGSMGILLDITERKHLEEQLLQAQKMESLGRLAGGIAHDFNNLLAIMLGFAELAYSELPTEHPICAYLDKIQTAAERGREVTGRLLVFARKQAFTPQAIDLGVLVSDAEDLIRSLIGSNVALEMQKDEALWPVLAHPGQFEQVLFNLVVNARDAMPDGGQLTLALRNVEYAPATPGTEPGLRPREYVCLTVRDTGVGMPPEIRGRIFEPFFTTKPIGQGTGLGLAMVYSLVTQSGGYIEVDSEPNGGTVFDIYLPRIYGPLTEQAGLTVTERSTGTETILLVEDEAALREMAAIWLERRGYTVFQAANGSEALAVVAQKDVPIHLLLTDVVMPQMGGVELAARLAELRPEIKVLFTTGYHGDPILRDAELMNNLLILQKPYSLSQLEYRVRHALDGIILLPLRDVDS
jgi:PAS domain S-box-containing protein